MKKLIVCFTGLCMCSSAWAAGTPAFMRDSVQAAENVPVTGNDSAQIGQKGQNGRTPSIEAGVPANDLCANRATIACNSSTVIDITGATTSATDPLFSCQVGGATQGFFSVWYQFVATSPESIVSTCMEQTGDDTVLQVFGPFANAGAVNCAGLGDSNRVGCSDDFGCGSSGFLSEILLPALVVGQTYVIELAGWDNTSAGIYQLDLDCDLQGACCIPTATPSCVANRQPGQCIDLGGIWQGAGTLCSGVTCVPGQTVCPSGSINETGSTSTTFGGEPGCGQPAPDNFNSGCNVTGGAFTFLLADGCNASVCGQSSADLRNGGAGGRDTDWYFYTPSETTQYTACAVAPFTVEVSAWQLDPGIDPCAASQLIDAEFGPPGTQVCNAECALRGNPYAFRITTVDSAGAPQRFGIGCVNYRLTTTCADCVSGACCVGPTCVAGTFPAGNPFAGEVVTQVNCEAQQGVYLGDGSTCAGAVCESACCLGNGSCVIDSRQDCINAGGAFFQGAVCADVVPCPVCTGEDPANLDGLAGTAEDCTALGADSVNSGCTGGSPGTLFSPISCGQTICGSTAFDGAFRDLDWFHLTVTAPTKEAVITFTNNTVGIADIRLRYYCNQTTLPACTTAGVIVLIQEVATAPAVPARLVPPGETVSFPRVLAPGRYTLLVTYDFANPNADCPTNSCCNYRITVDCSATACAVTRNCQNSENEAACGDPVNANPGCTATTPGARTPLPLNTKVCGDTRIVRTTVAPITLTRDLDTYAINIPTAGDYDFRIEAEFHALVFLQPLDGPGVCTDPAIFGFVIFQCGEIPYNPAFNGTTVTAENLPAGNYELLITPDFSPYFTALIGSRTGADCSVGAPPAGTQELCPSAYEIEVTGAGGCGTIICGDSNLNGSATVGDIGFFVTAVSQGFAAWDAAIPGVQTMQQFLCANDTDGNGAVTVGDIGRFVSVITGQPPGCAP